MDDLWNIVVCDKNEKTVFRYSTRVIPHKGELINFPHHGTFQILNVAYRYADDNPKKLQFAFENLMWVELIVDWENPVKDISTVI